MFQAAIQAGQAALQTSILINGGAAVALLAFIGNVWSQTQAPAVAKALALSVGLFSVGVLCGAVATGITYFGQSTEPGHAGGARPSPRCVRRPTPVSGLLRMFAVENAQARMSRTETVFRHSRCYVRCNAMNAPLKCGRCGKPIEPGTGYIRDGDSAVHLDCSRPAKRGLRGPARPVTPARKERRRSP